MTSDDCSCSICVGADPGREADISETVREHGWSALRVFGQIDFAYTVGLWHTFRRPEAVMFGLDGEGMQHWLSAYVDHARTHGWPRENEPFRGVLDGFDTQLRSVHEAWHEALFGTAYRFYRGRQVPVQQLVWPDRHGRWPWDDRATASSRNRQAMSWLPVGEHPGGGWRLFAEMGRDFPFPVGPDSWVLTTQGIADGDRQIARVARDQDSYDVLDERGYLADDLCLSFFGDLVRRHPHLATCADLADGQLAVTDGDQQWSRSVLSSGDRRDSERSWQHAARR